MFNIIHIHFVQATLIAVVFGFIATEYIRRRQAKKALLSNRKKLVGTIDANEVNQLLIQEENDIILRKKNLSQIKESKFNNSNESLKARSDYNNRLTSIENDRQSLLF